MQLALLQMRYLQYLNQIIDWIEVPQVDLVVLMLDGYILLALKLIRSTSTHPRSHACHGYRRDREWDHGEGVHKQWV
jgi:hypothetical protein